MSRKQLSQETTTHSHFMSDLDGTKIPTLCNHFAIFIPLKAKLVYSMNILMPAFDENTSKIFSLATSAQICACWVPHLLFYEYWFFVGILDSLKVCLKKGFIFSPVFSKSYGTTKSLFNGRSFPPSETLMLFKMVQSAN